MIVIPEIVILDSLNKLLTFLRKDYNSTLFAGTPATGTAVIVLGAIDSITIDDAGLGYPFPPIVTIDGDGTGASAITSIDDTGKVVLITVEGGSGYTAATITLTPDTTRSLLYRLLETNKVQRYELFKQAVALLITTEDDPRHLKINLFFNAARAAMPTLHITLPSESEKPGGIGISEGFRDPIVDENTGTSIRVFNRRFGAKYNIIFTSDNTNEVVLMYHFFRSNLISLIEHFNLSFLESIRISGGDIRIDSELVPVNVFSRAVGLETEYDVEAQELFRKDIFPFVIAGVNAVPDPITSNAIAN